MSLFDELNQTYLKTHTKKEDAFWANLMGLKDYEEGTLEKADIAQKEFITDATWLPKIREELKRTDLADDEKTGLEGWIRFFEANSIESEEAKELQKKIIEMEGELDRARRTMKLGYTDPENGEFVEASSVQLRLLIRTAKDEATRKAAWEGLRAIENFVLEHGFLDIVKERNRLGRMLGYDDYYSWKVKINEGITKEKVFELLGELEENTRDACRNRIKSVQDANDESAAEPWNFDFVTSGDLTAEKDPYLRFETALLRWGRSFSALGIKYRNAQLSLDLVERKGKYENGFMHGPDPAWFKNGEWQRARINFTANAVPGQVGSGKTALETFFHEGGHAAHFANIQMPSPCFAQEFAPTSIAYAETQSMFLDSIVGDADWLYRYAKDADGNAMPMDLIRRSLADDHLNRAHLLRSLMTVPFAEKALYEIPDAELTPEKVLATFREIEAQMTCQPSSARPVLSVPHLLAGDSSAYYHAYVLALMAVYQTRAFFLKRDGHLMDNPKIGPDMEEFYWKPGNSKSFLEYVESMTGEPFSAKASVELVNKSLDDVYNEAEASIEKSKSIPEFEGAVDLNATVRMVHGDEVIATSENSFEEMAEQYAKWIESMEKAAK